MGKIGEGAIGFLLQTNSNLTSRVMKHCTTKFLQNRIKTVAVGARTNRKTDRHTDRQWFYNRLMQWGR